MHGRTKAASRYTVTQHRRYHAPARPDCTGGAGPAERDSCACEGKRRSIGAVTRITPGRRWYRRPGRAVLAPARSRWCATVQAHAWSLTRSDWSIGSDSKQTRHRNRQDLRSSLVGSIPFYSFICSQRILSLKRSIGKCLVSYAVNN